MSPRPRSPKSTCFPRGRSGRTSKHCPRSPCSRSWAACPGRPRSPSSACSLGSWRSPTAGGPPASSRSPSPVFCRRSAHTPSSWAISPGSPRSLAPCRRAPCPPPSQAPAPGFCSARALGPGHRGQECSLTVKGPGWASDPAARHSGGPCRQPSAWDPLRPSPHCPQASGISRASGETRLEPQVGQAARQPGREPQAAPASLLLSSPHSSAEDLLFHRDPLPGPTARRHPAVSTGGLTGGSGGGSEGPSLQLSLQRPRRVLRAVR